MNYIELNGKIIRKDPVYYLQDIFNFPEYDGSRDMLYEHLLDIKEDTEIMLINPGCITFVLIDVFKKASLKNSRLTFNVDD